MHSLRQRINARDESGFTLIELLVVLIIIGVLLAIAVPSYLGFKDRAVKTQVQANVREAIPDAEAYYSDVGNYTNMQLTSGDAPDAGGLQGIDKGLPSTLVVKGAASGYCMSFTDKGNSWTGKVVGPGGDVTVTAGSAPCTSATG
ncbi:MAG TPA: prepilin-type N-terminal cleavage/methylation domain-containing protein [Gaiellaceae bacterium]